MPYVKMNKPNFTRKRSKTRASDKRVTKLAKQVLDRTLKQKVELKYFNASEWRNLVPFIPVAQKFSCIGFSSTTNTQPDGGAYQYPTGHNIYQLNALRPFTSSSTDVDMRRYAITGRECNPLSSLTKFQVARDVVQNINHLSTEPPPNQALGENVLHNAPVICRLITVTPKLASGINTEPDPAEDLFLNRYGSPIGVDALTIDKMDVMNNRVNKRRYDVQQDFKFVIKNPFNIAWTANAPEETRPYLVQVSPNVDYCERTVSSWHQLVQKKGGKVFYDDPNVSTTVNATSGHRRTYTLLHFAYQGVDNLSDNGDAPQDLYIDTNTVSRFTDM